MNNPLDLFAWKVRSERKRQHLTQRKLAERLNMNARTIIDLETCQSNPKFETVALVAKELNISVDAAIFPDMVPCNHLTRSSFEHWDRNTFLGAVPA